jgi:ADP-L-glycero-D-manno-heptose 6-epimerase
MIVVTGAVGFIGSRVLHALQKRMPATGLIAVDHPLSADKSENRKVSLGVRFLDHVSFLRELHGLRPEIIVHLGACSSTVESNWSYLEANNLEYSKSLWNWCAENNCRFIYASSAATYGDGSEGFDDDCDITRLKPLNLYAKSKQDFDLWVAERAESSGKLAQSVGLKFFNVFGPGESHKGRMASMVYHSFNQIRASGKVKLFQSHRSDFEHGGQLRDFIYVEQVVELIEQFLDKSEVSGLFNVGSGHARSFRDLAEAVFCALKQRPNIEYVPMPEDLRERYQYFTEAKMEKIGRYGVRQPISSLEDSVKEYVRILLN